MGQITKHLNDRMYGPRNIYPAHLFAQHTPAGDLFLFLYFLRLHVAYLYSFYKIAVH